MALVVQHNLMAMNSNRQLGITTSSQSKSAEKLSSGYRINRAGDDAAGLKISEKMRSQIRGLNKASTNAQDGVSLIQTAEGALNEAHSILQRMNELAVQGAINRVSTQRSALGALQNRLEHTIANLDNVSENTQAAESRIRDTDMAAEMVEYSKNNILAQAGQSMLAQANQATQGVLSILG